MTLGDHTDFEAHFLFNPPSGPGHCHSATILETSEQDLLACWYCYPDKETRDASLVITERRTRDQNWRKARPLMLSPKSSVGNPTLFEDPAGKIWLFYVSLAGHYWDSASTRGASSEDGGRTWKPPHTVWPAPGLMVRHPPLAIAGGSLLLPAYEESPPRTVLLRADPPYQKWHEFYRFEGRELIQPVLLRRGGSKLGLFFRPAGASRQVWRRFSSNEGRSWSAPVQTPLPNPLSGIAAFFSEDRDTVVYNASARKRDRLSLSHSRDGGVSWSKAAILDGADMEISYPAFTVGAGGWVHGVYTYNRRMIKYVRFPAAWWEQDSP